MCPQILFSPLMATNTFFSSRAPDVVSKMSLGVFKYKERMCIYFNNNKNINSGNKQRSILLPIHA